MRRRGCLTTLIIFVLLIVICVGAGWFIAIPKLRDNVRNDLAHGISTQVAVQLGGLPASSAGTETIDVSQFESQLQSSIGTGAVDNLHLSVTPAGMSISFDSNSTTFSYTGVPTVVNGKLVMADMKVDNGTVGFILPADKMGDAIEQAVNDYFAAQNLKLDDLSLGDDQITFRTSPGS